MISWVEGNDRYTQVFIGKLGKYRMFSISWDAACPPKDSQGASIPWKLNCRLPGIKDHIGHFKSTKEAKDVASMILKLWLGNTGLSITRIVYKEG